MTDNGFWHAGKTQSMRRRRPRSPESDNAFSASQQFIPPPPATRPVRRKRERENDNLPTPSHTRKKSEIPKPSNSSQNKLLRIASQTRISNSGNSLILSPKPKPRQELPPSRNSTPSPFTPLFSDSDSDFSEFDSTLRSSTNSNTFQPPLAFTGSNSFPPVQENGNILKFQGSRIIGGNSGNGNDPPPLRHSKKKLKRRPTIYFSGKKHIIGQIHNSWASFGQNQ